MTLGAPRWAAAVALCAALAQLDGGCTPAPWSGCAVAPRPAPEPCFVPTLVPLCVPRRAGWVADTSMVPIARAEGGIALRLVREGGIPGSPRIDVVLEAEGAAPTALDELLARNLQEMAALESAGRIHIDTVDQQRLLLGNAPAYRVHHEYTWGSGGAQVAVNQVSALLVLQGRGVAVTAVGRMELFHPLAESIQAILEGLRPQGAAAMAAPPPPAQGGDAAAPLDLGVVGGPRP